MTTRYPKKGKGSKWTPKELDAIPVEWKGDSVSDGEGLSGDIRVLQDGSISIKFKYGFRPAGESPTFYQCGTYPHTSLADIRKERDRARENVSNGIDPRFKKVADKIQVKTAIEKTIKEANLKSNQNKTFNDLYELWIKNGVTRKDGNKALDQCFKKHALPYFGRVPLKDLSEDHLRNRYKEIIADKHDRTAVVLSRNIAQMLNWAEKRQPWRSLLVEGNPVNLIQINDLLSQNYDPVRDRVLSQTEIRKLAEKFTDVETKYQNAKSKYSIEKPLIKESQIALWICLGTACRIGELLMAKWSQVDLKNGIWVIPKENVKGKRQQKQSLRVHLSIFALEKFEELHELTGHTEYLFPSRSLEKKSHVCLKSISKQVGDRQAKFMTRDKKALKRSYPRYFYRLLPLKQSM